VTWNAGYYIMTRRDCTLHLTLLSMIGHVAWNWRH